MTRVGLVRLLLCLLYLSALERCWAEWPGVLFTEVRAYAWKSDRVGDTVVLPSLKIAKGAIQPKGVVLSPERQALLLKAQVQRRVPRPVAMCYNPHHAFVFYQDRKPVAFLEICLDCLGARLWPEDPECDPDFLILGQLCHELNLPLGRFASIEALQREVAPIYGRKASTLP